MCHGMMLHESGVSGDAKRERDEADDAVVAGTRIGFFFRCSLLWFRVIRYLRCLFCFSITLSTVCSDFRGVAYIVSIPFMCL